MRVSWLGSALALGIMLGSTASADAASPITVSLRVIGPGGVVFEGSTTSERTTFSFTDQPTERSCDAGTGSVTFGSVLAQAAESGQWLSDGSQSPTTGFPLTGTFDQATETPNISTIGGQEVADDPARRSGLTGYRNGHPVGRAFCQQPVTTGDRLVLAYGPTAAPPVPLRIDQVGYTGNPCADPNAGLQLRVVDDETSQPVAGASVQGHASDGQGLVIIGPGEVRATKDGYVPSNRYTLSALPCPYAGPPTTEATQPTAPVTMAPSGGGSRASRRLYTLKAVGSLRPSALRFVATADRRGNTRVVVRVGNVTIVRSLSFRSAGRLSFSVIARAAQRRRLRRLLARGPIAVKASIEGEGASASTSSALHR